MILINLLHVFDSQSSWEERHFPPEADESETSFLSPNSTQRGKNKQKTCLCMHSDTKVWFVIRHVVELTLLWQCHSNLHRVLTLHSKIKSQIKVRIVKSKSQNHFSFFFFFFNRSSDPLPWNWTLWKQNSLQSCCTGSQGHLRKQPVSVYTNKTFQQHSNTYNWTEISNRPFNVTDRKHYVQSCADRFLLIMQNTQQAAITTIYTSTFSRGNHFPPPATEPQAPY